MRGRNGPRGATPAETIGQVISRVDAVLGDIRPDAVLILGDTNSCLAAIAAERRRIPVFHMEAGVFGCVPGFGCAISCPIAPIRAGIGACGPSNAAYTVEHEVPQLRDCDRKGT